MSYQVLARKYRPKSFETLVGQEHVVRALTHALEQQRLHHAYLFTGTRGVGKTTLSRILAKSFNCEKGITAQACGICDACTAIDAGRFVDYIEMDAASNRGVDEMASLLEQAIYAPSNARFKVYMIDEVHMLTNHAFNSMLKTLEEPPPHVKFILATTDPQKIPVTVLSRCLQFNLKQMPPGHIVGHLENILGQEHIDFEVPALRLLAQGAHGSMRDALSLTDQAIAYAAGKVSLDAVQNMLGALDQSYLIRLLDALAVEDGAALLSVADEMAARSLSYKSALQDLGTLLHQISIAQLVPAALADDLPERAELIRLAQLFSKEEVQLFYQIAVHGRNEIGLAPDEYAGFSMTLLRMLAFRPGNLPPAGGAGGGGQTGVRPSPVTPNRSAAVSQASSGNPATRSATVGLMPNGVPAQTPSSSISTVTQSSEAESKSENKPDIEQETIEDKALAGIRLPPPAPKADNSLAVAAPTTNSGKLSPAMAALAAARAASGRNQGAAVRSSNVVVAPTAPAQVKAEAMQEPPKVTPIAPRVPEHRDVSSTNLQDGEMPPPWDDAEFASVALQSGPPLKQKDLNDSDYFVEAGQTIDSQHSRNGEVSEAGALVELAPPVAVVPKVEASKLTVKPLQLIPIAEISWDGHWPNLAASLPVRGVTHQLAQQSELRQCFVNGNAVVFRLCVPVQTLLSAGSLEKLSAALNERFAKSGHEIRIETEIGAVEQTANAQALAERAERQDFAERAIQEDGFVQTLMREFGATILTGSVRPI
ncbi:DNA polymerase III subunit gamma/tau [Undibacterium sp. LX40W]|uniref:DNA polymerase III subunit gamma/tau n=1 Tax=Undibacterium nitidum TaxID=2762298 RepID=A0A923HL24_9BURK|nr:MULTISPECIES: DNA polymerase III subunit gamma/tau [Undibacterium]MBC3879756.1 DNA polymerase III subunit gamma/tau [Undibacterium nitidum]MBC3891508.1 DNA polymerase III subunit gamma/tau [Undibacterium sp. LX40W]